MCNSNCSEHKFRRGNFDFVVGGPKPAHPKFVAFCKEEYEKTNNPRYFGSPVLIQYLRDENNNRFGVMISYKEGGGVRFGWSVCQTDLDKWDRYIGFHYAFKRSKKDLSRIPDYLVFDMDDFVERSFRYFQLDPKNTPTNLGVPLVTEG